MPSLAPVLEMYQDVLDESGSAVAYCGINIPNVAYTGLLAYVFYGHPIGYKRMTKGTMWRDDAQSYLGYRNELANSLRAKYPSLVQPEPPPTKEKKARALWNKEQAKTVFALYVDVYAGGGQVGDWDNFYKAVADSIQLSGIVSNDRQIKTCFGGSVFVDKENPRIEFALFRGELS